jgi:tetratricopeptide (TPR) repeat protein
MYSFDSEIKLAKYFLSRHMPKKALDQLVKAIKVCPSCKEKELARLLFYLGVTLKKLGHSSSAIRFWISSYRLNKNKYARQMIKRFSNGYGFKKEENNELDDIKAFFSIQISRYLAKKKSKHFSTQAEVDMIKDLLEEKWKNIQQSGILEKKSIEEKHKYFKGVKIVFPFMFFTKVLGDSVINVNFNRGTKVVQNERCICGSGLPYYKCCGRAPSLEEMADGFF